MPVQRFHRKNGCLKFLGFHAAFFLVMAGSAVAGEEPFGLTLRERAIWDSNPLMLSRDATDIWGSATTVTLDYDKGNQETQLKTALSMTHNVFNEREYNSTDFSGSSDLSWNFKRLRLSLGADADYDTTRTSEITTFDRDIGSDRRFSYELSPSFLYVISPRGLFSLSSSWREVRYDGRSFSDYRTTSLTPSFSYNVTPLQQLQFSTLMRRYTSLLDSDQKVDTVGPSLSWTYEIDPSLSFALSGGLYRSKYKGYINSSGRWETAPSFSGALNYKDEQNKASVSLIRSRHAYANGTESYITSLSARERYQVNDNFSVDFDASYHVAKQPPVSSSSLEKAWDAETGLSYAITRKWDLRATYKHRQETLKNSDNDSDRNVVRFGLSYKM